MLAPLGLTRSKNSKGLKGKSLSWYQVVLARSALRSRGPRSELSANFLDRSKSSAAPFLARLRSGLGLGAGLGPCSFAP